MLGVVAMTGAPTPMSPIHNRPVLQEAEELDWRADALEKESATWPEYDISQRPKFPTRAYEDACEEEGRRANILWENAVAVGTILSALCDRGALDHEPRTKNAVHQTRAEMNRCRREGKPPISYFIVNVLYNPHKEDSYEVFLVRMFEGFCKIWAKSYEDRRAFESYYMQPKDRAAFHVRMMKALSKSLKEEHGPSSA